MGVKCTRVVKYIRKGDQGEHGIGVRYVDVEYASSASNETAPSSGWNTDAPKWQNGFYIWSRTHIVYTDGTDDYTSAVCITGEKGEQGNGVVDIIEEYYRSTSALTPTGGSWSTTRPSWINGRYMWTRSHIILQDSDYYTTPICVTGEKGATGAAATTYYTWIKYADDANGTNMADDPVKSDGTFREYIGFAYNKTTATESNTPSDYKWSLFRGAQGPQGIQGPQGNNGNSLYTWIKYADSVLSTGYPNTMYDTPKNTTKYIGIAVNKTTATESTVPSAYSWSKFRGDDGTSFSVKGNALGHYTSVNAMNADVAKLQTNQSYLVDNTTNHALIRQYRGNTTYTQESAEDGDAYIVESTGHLWVATGEAWQDMGSLQGPQGPQGPQGEDALNIYVTNQDVVFTAIGQMATIRVEAWKGNKQLTYSGTTSPDNYACRGINDTPIGLILDGKLYVEFECTTAKSFEFHAYCASEDINNDATFIVDYNGTQHTQHLHFRFAKKGERGDRGPSLRGPQAWNDKNNGYAFQQGATGEPYKDVVLYNGNYYSCIKSHIKASDNYPTSAKDNTDKLWQLGDKVELVATNILLATYALVKNLGVEAIDMKDSDGNVLFQAKDGVVQCKTGIFDGISVKNANLQNVKIDGIVASPFVIENSTETLLWDGDNTQTYYAAMAHDNLLYNSSSHHLYWQPECSGRLITMCHHESVTGSTTFYAPTVYQASAPAWQEGKNLWRRIRVLDKDSTERFVGISCIAPSTGKAIRSVTTYYYLSTSSTTQTGGSWSTSAPTWASGKYIWVREYIVFTDGSTTYTSAQLVSDTYGVGISSVQAQYAIGASSSSAPIDMCFYEDGMKRKSITVSRQCVILKGYGTATTFLGYIVVNRIDLAPTREYGRHTKCLAMGVVSYSGSVGISYTTFDGRTLSVSRTSTGLYKVTIPKSWNIQEGKLIVMASTLGDIYNGSNPLYAGVHSIEVNGGVVTGFSLQCGDDTSRNDGSVQFMIFNRADWEMI